MTVFAQGITLAASFNAPLLRAVGDKIGQEGRAIRNHYDDTLQFPNKTGTPNGLACFSPQVCCYQSAAAAYLQLPAGPGV